MPHLGAPLWRMTPDRCLQLTLARPLLLEPLAKREHSTDPELADHIRGRLALGQFDLGLSQHPDDLLHGPVLGSQANGSSQTASRSRLPGTFGL